MPIEQAALLFTTTLRERFAEYHRARPEVYAHLVRLARDAKAAGHQRYGAKSLVERVRWHYHVERGQGEFKIDNSLTALYARLIMQREADLAGFFETRERRCE